MSEAEIRMTFSCSSPGRGMGRLCWRTCQRMVRNFLVAWGDTKTQVRDMVGWGLHRRSAQSWVLGFRCGEHLGTDFLPSASANQGSGKEGRTGLPGWGVSSNRASLGSTGRASFLHVSSCRVGGGAQSCSHS